MNSLTFRQANDLIREKLRLGNPFSLVRTCNTMGYIIDCFLQQIQLDPNAVNGKHFIEMGISPIDMNYLYTTVLPKTLEVTSRADILGFVDCNGSLKNSKAIQTVVGKRPTFFSDDFLVLDPVALTLPELQNVDPLIEEPWTTALRNKKVLVISSHKETILSQAKNLHHVWGNNVNRITPFEFVGVIRSPFHPLLDDRQHPGCNNWHETISYIKREMESIDFDVLLVGSATTAPFFADHAKTLGKVGIHIGGTIQLFFGILGYRWSHVDAYRAWRTRFNDSWVQPFQQDKMQRGSGVLESCFAYW